MPRLASRELPKTAEDNPSQHQTLHSTLDTTQEVARSRATYITRTPV